MSITKVSKFVLEDSSVSLSKLDTTSAFEGQILAVGAGNTLQFEDKLVTEDVEDIVAGLILRGNHTNISVSYIDGTNQLNLNASGAVTSVNTQTGAVVLDTDDIVEGTGNLYWTEGRFNSSFAVKDTDDLSEGTLNLYFTDQRVHDAISVTDLSGDGSLTYANGIITYTGPSANEVRAHFSAGTGVSIANGEISIGQDVSPSSNVVFNDINATNNVIIDGNLTVSGTTTTVFSETTRINENLLYLNEGGEATITGAVGNGTTVTYTADNTYSVGYTVDITGVTPSSFNIVDGVVTATDDTTFTITSTVTDTYVSGGEAYGHAHVNADLGWVGAYDDGTYAHTGLFRDASDGVFKIFDSYTVEPSDSSSINTAHASYNSASMLVDNLTAEGNITATNISGDGTNITNVLTNYSTTDLSEGTNLYFTDERVDDRVAALMTPGTNITMHYDDIAGTFTINSTGFAGSTTDDLLEGSTHLYFTEERVDDRVSDLLVAGNNITITYDDNAGTLTIDGIEDDFSNNTTDNLSEGSTNLYFTDERAQDAVASALVAGTNTNIVYDDNANTITISATPTGGFDLSQNTTDDLSEGTTNLYYTDTRVRAALTLNDTSEFDTFTYDQNTGTMTHSGVTTSQIRSTLSGGTGVTYNDATGEISIGQDVAIASDVQFENMVLTGNLTVSGAYTVVNTETINLADNILLLNSNETGVPTQSGGIEIERGTDVNVSFLWNEGSDYWTLGSENLFTSGTFLGDLQGDVIGNVTGQITDISNHTTDDLSEGISNFYWTDTRFNDAFDGKDSDDLSEGVTNLYWTVLRTRGAISTSGDLTYNSGTGVIHFDLTEHTTSELPEGTNLYYTESRVDSRVDVLRTDLTVSGDATVHFDNISNVPAVTKDVLTGDNTNSTFNLSATPGNADAVIVTMNGVTQMPGSDYTVSGSTITFTTTPPSGQIILVRHVGYQIVGSVADNDLSITGGTMSGSILVNADNTYDLGSATNQWRTVYGHEIEATFADLAERYASDAPYLVGTVVIYGGEAEITTTTDEMDVSVAGIISGSPALKMNAAAGNSQTHPYVALKGRVPCQVIGPVTKGDLLVTSSTPGFAKSVGKRDLGLAVLAKALETNLDDGRKMVEVAVV